MRFSSVFSGPFRWLAPLLCMIACCGVASAQGCKTATTITGTVYAPNGTDPLPNILVYIPTTPVLAFAAAGPGTDCNNQNAVVSGLPALAQASTDYKGNFTLTATGLNGTVPLVIQAGKWRSQLTVNVTCGTNPPAQKLLMPAAAGPGNDLPNIAISTGSSDALECVFRKIGISDSEFTAPGKGGHISLYAGSHSAGITSDANSNTLPSETTLVDTAADLGNYDLMLFACQGSPTNPAAANTTYQQNLVDYADLGGRIFTTHYSYVWLDDSTVFAGTANWALNLPDESISANDINATIDQSYPEGAVLANWLYYIGASTTQGQIPLASTKKDQTGVIAPTQSWATLDDATDGNPVMQFTFDTPIGAAGAPSVAITYTNSTTTFLQGDKSDTVTIDVTNNSTTSAGSSLTLSVAVPGGITPTQFVGTGNTGWACDLATLICTRSTTLAAGASDPVALTFSIAPTAPVGSVSLTASLTGGGLSNTSQCGRVLFNEYHVETSSTGKKIFPQECETGAMTAQEKFLEFSLYNLSNFVAPSTSDTFVIQGPVTIVWAQPAPISYGTALTSTGQLDASATDSANGLPVAGSFVYTPPVGTVLQANASCPNLSVVFTPTDSTDYVSAMATKCLEVDPAGTTTTLVTALGSTTPGAVTPIYYGQIIGDTAVMAVTSNNPGVGIDGGNMLFYINGQVQCNIPITVIECPATTGAGYDAGTYQVYSAYSGDSNFLASQSAVYSVTVLPDPTLTTLASSASISPPGQAITFTGNIADQYYSPVAGTVTFSDGTTVLGTVPVNASDVATYTTSSLNIGVHSIKACFVSAVDPSGTYDFVNSCSSAIPEAISLPSTIGTTSTTLTSSLNPSVVGQTVTFSATAATTGSFISTPTGTVTFYDGANQIGSGILNNGVATLAISTLAAGLHNITASYLGSSTMAPSTSAILVQQVNVGIGSAGQGFLMTVSPTTFSVGAGSSVSVAVTILDLNNFNLPVALGCSGLPTEATCTFSTPTIVAPGGTTPLTITVNAPHNCDSNTPYFVAGTGNTVLPILATVVFAFFARRRRILKGIALAAILCLLPAINGCGGNCTDLGVRPGTYTFTVTGTTSGAVPVTVAVPAGGASTIPGTSQSQTMIMTVTI